MTRDEFNAYCRAKRGSDHVNQWGNSDVWKVGGKVFAICGWGVEDAPAFTFKVTPLAFEVLSDQPGLRPAPYLASRGLKWIQQFGAPGLGDKSLRDHIDLSYDLVAAGLTRKARAELGL